MQGDYEEFEMPDSYASPDKPHGGTHEPSKRVPRPYRTGSAGPTASSSTVSSSSSGAQSGRVRGKSAGTRGVSPAAAAGARRGSPATRHTSLEEARANRSPMRGGVLASRIATQRETLDGYKRQMRERDAREQTIIPSDTQARHASATPRSVVSSSASVPSGVSAHSAPSASPSAAYAAARASDLQRQLKLLQKQLHSREQKLTTLESTLQLEEERAEALAAEADDARAHRGAAALLPEVGSDDVLDSSVDALGETYEQLDTALQSERRMAKDAEAQLEAARAALAMTQDRCDVELHSLEQRLQQPPTPPGPAPQEEPFSFGGLYRSDVGGQAATPYGEIGGSQIDTIRMQMRARLNKVKEDMAAQFAEERSKLESRAEYLSRMNQRKDDEIESIQQRKAEIHALIEQARATHKEGMNVQQSRYEHQHRQTIQHESNAAKLDRELRMLTEECHKLRERLRKTGITPDAPALGPPPSASSPGPSRRAPPR